LLEIGISKTAAHLLDIIKVEELSSETVYAMSNKEKKKCGDMLQNST